MQVSSPTIPQSVTNGPIQYPQIARTLVPHSSGSSFNGSAGSYGLVSPPQASLHPTTLSRRRSDYHDQSQEALALTGAGFAARASIDYPDLSAQRILRPPPVAAAPKERARNHAHSFSMPPAPPTIPSDYPVTYWGDVQIGTMGLKNLGNTCYMNSTIQCLSATVPFAWFFTGEFFAFFRCIGSATERSTSLFAQTVGGRAPLIWSTRWGQRATLCTHFRASCTIYGMERCRIFRPFNFACAWLVRLSSFKD